MTSHDLKKLQPDQTFEGVKVRDIIRWIGERRIGLDDTIVTRSEKPMTAWDKYQEVTAGNGILILEVRKGE